MALIPRKTYPELDAQAGAVQSGDVIATYRSPGPLKRTTAGALSTFIGGGKLDADGSNAASDILTNLPYLDPETGSVETPVFDWMSRLPINAATFDFLPDGTDRSAEWRAALDAAVESGRELYVPEGSYRVDTGATLYLQDTIPGTTAFQRGWRIRGAGSGRTIINSNIPNGWLIDATVGNGAGGEFDFATYKGVLGGYMKGLTISAGSSPGADSGGVRLRSHVQFRFEDVNVQNITGDAFKIKCLLGDLDGSNQVSWTDCRVDGVDGWGADVGTDGAFNENSFMTFVRCFWQGCGTAEQKAITGITQANPGVVTCTGHGLTNGQRVFIAGITTGMTQVNSADAATSYVVTVVDANSFSIGVNTTGYTAYTSGGFMIPRTPQSGGVRVKGQITTFQSCGWTINKNRSLFIDGDGGGLPQDVFLYDSTIENPQIIGFHTTGCKTIIANGLHLYSNQSISGGPNFWGHLYDGDTNAVSDIDMNGLCIRSTAAETAYTTFQAIGVNVDRQSINLHPDNMHVKQFGYTGQTMYRGLYFDAIPQNCIITALSAISVVFRPDPFIGRGNTTPLRVASGGSSGLTYLGAYVPVAIPNTGVAISNASLAANTTYNAYLYADNITTPTPRLELSTTAPVQDEFGYMVKTGDGSRLFVGRVRTDGSSQFITSGGAFLNPLAVSSPQAGVPSWLWVSQTDRKLYYKTLSGLPASEAGGDYSYWPIFEFSQAYDPPSLAAGATTTVDVTATCGAGDYCSGVSFSTGWGGLTATGSVKAANTVTVTLTNNTAGAIDLAAGTVRVAITRR